MDGIGGVSPDIATQFQRVRTPAVGYGYSIGYRSAYLHQPWFCFGISSAEHLGKTYARSWWTRDASMLRRGL